VSAQSRRHVFLDVGTTNARAYLVESTRVLARASASVGVRDSARDGSNQRLKSALKDLVSSLAARELASPPSLVIGAGMISSSLGLAEVPHVSAPATLSDVAAAIRTFSFPDITPLPVLLVPGVRTGHFSDGPSGIGEVDLMRGEETLCLGLLSLGHLGTPATVLNLGSHWKAIRIDADNRIAASVTSLSGEMIHAVQSSTILASAVQQGKPADVDTDWVDQGIAEHRASGLARALFCVRLLEQSHLGTSEQRMSFLLGAFIASDLDSLNHKQFLSPTHPVTLVGPAPLARAWQHALTDSNIPSQISPEETTEAATIAGLNDLLLARANSATS
jgi:2-dehydro-3-deoxygalactonokinase